MTANTSFVDRLRPLLADRSVGEQLYVIALLESRSAERYREWAEQVAGEDLVHGLRRCAEREDIIAAQIRTRFKETLEQPTDFEQLLRRIQAEVVAIFGGRSREEQFEIQAQAERGGERLWNDLAAAESDAGTKAMLLECAALEAGSAEFLESLGAAATARR